MSDTTTVTPLRQRMIEDMAARKLNPHTQQSEGPEIGLDSAPAHIISIKHPDTCKFFSLNTPMKIPMKSFDDGTSFSISEYVPDYLIDAEKKCTSKISGICAGSPWGICRDTEGLECLDDKPRDVCEKLKNKPSEEVIQKFLASLPSFLKDKNRPIIYKRECSDTPICLHGQLEYKDDLGNDGTLKFRSIVILGGPLRTAPALPSYTYEVFLTAGRSNYEERKSISQEIKPGDVDHFLITIATDRSASFNFTMDIIAAGGAVVWSGEFGMSLFVPRSLARLVAKRNPSGAARPTR